MASTAENAKVTQLRAVADPVERAAACQTFITNGRATLAAVEQLRDQAIRDARAAKAGTVDSVAARIGARRNVVVDALRKG